MTLVLDSKVVVGKQGRTPTPVFIAEMNQVDFLPYWNVPISIARGEILPRLRRDPGYLERQQMEFVAADGRTVSRQVTAANLAAVAAGTMRIRQRPGGENALGKVKFTMPNSMNIYLHDTPSRSLFSQSRRDFSHGCIRVEKPAQLARYALGDDPAWDEAAIAQAMAGDAAAGRAAAQADTGGRVLHHRHGRGRRHAALPAGHLRLRQQAGRVHAGGRLSRSASAGRAQPQRRTLPVSMWTKFDAG